MEIDIPRPQIEMQEEYLDLDLDAEEIFSEICGATAVVGNVQSRKGLRIEGVVRGNVTCESTIYIGSNGRVFGDVETPRCIILGYIEGDVYADEITMGSTGVLKGSALYRQITAFTGAVITGDFLPLLEGRHIVTIQPIIKQKIEVAA